MGFVGTENSVEDVAFDAAFNEALDAGISSDDAPAADADAPAADTDAPAADTDAPAADTDAPVVDTDAPVVAAPVVDPPVKTAEQLELEQVKADLVALKAKVVTPPTLAPAADEPKPPTVAELQAKTEEEKVWADFKVDWPEVAAMMEKRQATTEARLAQALDIVKQLSEQVAPLATAQAQSDNEKFIQTILTSHADANTLLPDLEKWVETLPRHRQVGANFVLDRGSAQDVVALYNEFKVDTGRIAQTPPPPSEQKPQPAADTANRLRKMESVSSRRTSHQEPPDSSDFDGAFAEALSSDKL